jgi:site-specific recombinase XerD
MSGTPTPLRGNHQGRGSARRRQTFATTGLQKGISLPTVQKILGHDRLQTTAIYVNFTDAPIQDEFARKG